MKSCLVVAVGITTAIANADAQTPPRPASEVIPRAVAALGGQAFLDLRNKTIDFNTVTFALGQEETPTSPARATLVSGRTTYDYQNLRLATSQEQRPVAGGVNRLRRVTLRNRMSMSELNGTLSMDAATVPYGLGRALSLEIDKVMASAAGHIEGIVALRPRTLRGEVADGIRVIMGPDTVRVYFDRITGLPVATEVLIDDSVLGDRRTLTWYTRWQPVGGVLLPRQIDVEVNGRLLSHTVVTSAAVNQELDAALFAIPDSMASRAPALPSAPPALSVNMVNLAPGLWRAEGGSHHSLIVDQGQSLLVIEAPQSTARSNAVLDTLQKRFPGRRVSAVVMTHHHHDHSGGVRAYMARGIPVIAHTRNVAFAREVGAARKTVAPDRLTRGALQPPAVTAVSDSMVIGRGPNRVILYTLPTIHAEGVLVAWHPASGTVFTSDVLSPAANQPPARIGSVEMVAFARARGLTPTWFAGGHGTVAEWTAIQSAAR